MGLYSLWFACTPNQTLDQQQRDAFTELLLRLNHTVSF
jgi:hypothetical protein